MTEKKTEYALTTYGSREEVKDLAERIVQMLPGVKKLGNAAALALAQVALTMGLNPFIGEIWAIPQKGGTFTITPGIKLLRKAARSQVEKDGGYYLVTFRHPREEEVDGMIINAGDIIRACDVQISGPRAVAFTEDTGKLLIFSGIGIYRKGEGTRMEPLQAVRKRAEADALKLAFDLPVSFSPEAPSISAEYDDALPAEQATRGPGKLFKDVKPAQEPWTVTPPAAPQPTVTESSQASQPTQLKCPRCRTEKEPILYDTGVILCSECGYPHNQDETQGLVDQLYLEDPE